MNEPLAAAPSAGAAAKKRYQLGPDYVVRHVGEDVVIVPVGEGNAFANAMLTPNRTAAFLLEQFASPITEEEAVAAVMDRFEGSQESVQNDVRLFIEQSLNVRILMEVDGR